MDTKTNFIGRVKAVFFIKKQDTIRVSNKHYFVKKLSGAFFLKAFGFNFKIAIGKFFVL